MTLAAPKIVRFDANISIQLFSEDTLSCEIRAIPSSSESIRQTRPITRTSLLITREHLHLKQKRLQKTLNSIDDLLYDCNRICLTRKRKKDLETTFNNMVTRITSIATYLRTLNLDSSYNPLKPLIHSEISQCILIVQQMKKLKEISKLLEKF